MKKNLLFLVCSLLLAANVNAQTIVATPDEETPFLTLSFADSLNVFPNPFTDSATIIFSIAATDSVTLQVFDLLGDERMTLFQDTVMTSDSYSVTLQSDSLQAGMYIVKLKLSGNKSILKQALKVSQPATIQNTLPSTSFSLHPNPATTNVTITTTHEMIGSTITITDIMGRKILAAPLPTATYLLSTDFSNDIYLLTLTAPNGKSATKRLVISR